MAFANRAARRTAPIVLLLLTAAAPGVSAPDGTLLSEEPCSPGPAATYEQYVAGARAAHAAELAAGRAEGHALPRDDGPALLGRAEVERRLREDVQCRRLVYASDGLRVVAYLWKPRETGGRRLPVVVYNRGGNRAFGELSPATGFGLRPLLDAGFLVLASQYRGNDGGEGKEEWGGADVRDVLALLPLAASLGYADPENVFMYGRSRGAVMTFLAVKAGARVNAAVAEAGPADLAREAARRPRLEGVWRELVPEYETRREEALRARSALAWPERLDVPLLLLHGAADWRVAPGPTLELARRLVEANAEVELVLYAGDDHQLQHHRADADARIVAWFRRHLRPPAPPHPGAPGARSSRTENTPSPTSTTTSAADSATR